VLAGSAKGVQLTIASRQADCWKAINSPPVCYPAGQSVAAVAAVPACLPLGWHAGCNKAAMLRDGEEGYMELLWAGNEDEAALSMGVQGGRY
jgi:hypothetical protein